MIQIINGGVDRDEESGFGRSDTHNKNGIVRPIPSLCNSGPLIMF